MRSLRGIAEDVQTILAQGPAVAQNAAAIISRIGPYVGTVRRVVDDPAFPTVIQRIQTIADIEASSAASSGGGPTTTTHAGVGLSRAVPVLDAYIFARRNPWTAGLVVGGIIAIIAGLGYRYGKRKG
jgi:hypothetical protein